MRCGMEGEEGIWGFGGVVCKVFLIWGERWLGWVGGVGVFFPDSHEGRGLNPRRWIERARGKRWAVCLVCCRFN